MNAIKKNLLLFSLLVLSLFSGCREEPPLLSALHTPLSARAEYEMNLGITTTPEDRIITQWDSISNLAFLENVEIPTPFYQTGHFLEGRAEVLAFRVPLKKGEQIDINLKTDTSNTQVFMDFFRKNESFWKPILKSKKDQKHFHFVVPETDTFLLRIQPEFHKKATYFLKISKRPTYTFPVAGKGNEDIWSFWNDPRDGGRRKHKGIDIFAKRGTPLLAAVKGHVVNVSDRGLGGKQVWIRDFKTRNSLYYAHLDKQLVKEGQIVEAGDTIGLVGNTGNARSTRPHLHFGIYARRKGPVDPLPYVYTYTNRLPNNTAKIKPDVINQGITLTEANLRSKPNNKKSLIKKINKGSPIELLGASGRWFHVRTLDGLVGYIHHSSLRQLKANVLL